jgi:hypothetical protein
MMPVQRRECRFAKPTTSGNLAVIVSIAADLSCDKDLLMYGGKPMSSQRIPVNRRAIGRSLLRWCQIAPAST